jgi:hypothetical protein
MDRQVSIFHNCRTWAEQKKAALKLPNIYQNKFMKVKRINEAPDIDGNDQQQHLH